MSEDTGGRKPNDLVEFMNAAGEVLAASTIDATVTTERFDEIVAKLRGEPSDVLRAYATSLGNLALSQRGQGNGHEVYDMFVKTFPKEMEVSMADSYTED
jgi:hypothetical protein